MVSGLNEIPQELAATFLDVCCLKCPKYFGYSNSYEFYESLRLQSLGKGVLGTQCL